MKKITYEINKFQNVHRLLIITETYDEINQTGGIGFDVIMSGSREACLKKKEELENEKNLKKKTKSNRKQNNYISRHKNKYLFNYVDNNSFNFI